MCVCVQYKETLQMGSHDLLWKRHVDRQTVGWTDADTSRPNGVGRGLEMRHYIHVYCFVPTICTKLSLYCTLSNDLKTICDSPCEEVHPRGLVTINYDVIYHV